MKCEIDVGQEDGSESRKDDTAVPTDAIPLRQSDESEFYLANRANRPLETSPRPIYLISWRNMYRNSQSRQYTTPRTTRRHATHDTNAAHELCLGCV